MDAGIGAKATVLDCMGSDGEGNCASLQGSVTWRIASGRREREGMDAGIGAKATVLDCMGGDGEGNCASLQA
jgi:hypothetical protein